MLLQDKLEQFESHDDDHEYPAGQKGIHQYKNPIYRNIYRRTNIAYISISMSQYMMERFTWSDVTITKIW